MKKLDVLILLFLSLFLWQQVRSQSNKGQITEWILIDNPHGVSSKTTKEFTIRWDVLEIGPSGGHIQAKLWLTNKPECFSTADFKWKLSPEVSNINQDEEIKVSLAIDAKANKPCAAPSDPYLGVFVMSGIKWDKSIGGDISLKGKDLFGYASKGTRRVSVSGYDAVKTADINLKVKDRTSAGVDRDAQDGGFGVELNWRGNTYVVFYKYLAR